MVDWIKSYFRILFQIIGGAMIVFSETLRMFPFATSGDWQLWGLGLFMDGVITQMIVTQKDIKERKGNEPKLIFSLDEPYITHVFSGGLRRGIYDFHSPYP